MEELEKQVRRAHRRMGFQRFAGVLGWCWFATLLMALGLIALERFYPLGMKAWGWAARSLAVDQPAWIRLVVAGGWLAAGLVLGLLAAVVFLVATRRKPLAAAIEIDRRFALKERVSSTLALTGEDRQSPAGKALIGDAVRRVRRVDVAGRFSLTPGRPLLLPLLPAVLAVLVAWFGAEAKTEEAKSSQSQKPPVSQPVQKPASELLRQKLAERQKQAEKLGLEDAERLFEKLQEAAREMAEGKTERKDALVKLNEAARELQDHRDRAGAMDKIKEQLDRIKDFGRGPADDFAKAVRRGDFGKAAEELEKMKQKLADDELDDEQKKQLADQLEQMQKKLEQIVQEHAKTREKLQQQIDQLRDNGQLAKADELQQKLDQLLGQMPQMGRLGQMADRLGECAGGLRNGQSNLAADALGNLQTELQQQSAELELIEQAMQQLSEARMQINCKQCGGFG